MMETFAFVRNVRSAVRIGQQHPHGDSGGGTENYEIRGNCAPSQGFAALAVWQSLKVLQPTPPVLVTTRHNSAELCRAYNTIITK
jgi:hypothetical protein